MACYPVALRERTHDVRGRSARVKQLNHRLHVRIDGFEEVFVCRAKVVQSRLAVRRVDESIFWAFTIAREADLAFAAIVRQRVEFLTAELSLPGRIRDLTQAVV